MCPRSLESPCEWQIETFYLDVCVLCYKNDGVLLAEKGEFVVQHVTCQHISTVRFFIPRELIVGSIKSVNMRPAKYHGCTFKKVQVDIINKRKYFYSLFTLNGFVLTNGLRR